MSPNRPGLSAHTGIPFYQRSGFAWLLLAGITLLAYINAWPDVVVFDDKVFLGGGQFENLAARDFAGFFSETLWAASGNTDALYRPLLLVLFGLESRVFGQWWSGYHGFNVLMHTTTVLLVFGLVRELLWSMDFERKEGHWAALAAALVFAVHPVLTDAVNSLFNVSEVIVTGITAGGLWYLLRNVDDKPVQAWSMLAVLYLLGLLFRENAVALSALAVLVLWVTSREPWAVRVKRCLPVFLLLVPLACYLALRTHAVQSVRSQVGPEKPVVAEVVQPAEAVPAEEPGFYARYGLRYDPGRSAQAAKVWFDGLGLWVWPHPLVIVHEASGTPLWLALSVQAALLALALYALYRGHIAFLAGLGFFYVAILPSSRIVSEGALAPLLLERMLYLPSIGIVIALAAGLALLARKLPPRFPIAVVVLTVFLLTPLTWARNADWTDELRLVEGDLASRGHSQRLLISAVRANRSRGYHRRAMELCNRYPADLETKVHLARACGEVFVTLGDYARAERIFQALVGKGKNHPWVHFELARLYVKMGRPDDAQRHFAESISREKNQFLREFMTALMLLEMYPNDRVRMRKAREHLESALSLQPRAIQARRLLEQIDQRL